jgi:hypothetical protein
VLIWPVQFHAFGDPSRADSFSVDSVLLPALAVCCAALLLACGLYWVWKRGERDAALIGALLLLLPLVPALNLNGLNPDDYLHGRYAYLSSAGLALLIATGWHLATKWRTPLLLPAAASKLFRCSKMPSSAFRTIGTDGQAWETVSIN